MIFECQFVKSVWLSIVGAYALVLRKVAFATATGPATNKNLRRRTETTTRGTHRSIDASCKVRDRNGSGPLLRGACPCRVHLTFVGANRARTPRAKILSMYIWILKPRRSTRCRTRLRSLASLRHIAAPVLQAQSGPHDAEHQGSNGPLDRRWRARSTPKRSNCPSEIRKRFRTIAG